MKVYCAECEHECSEQAAACPACGHPLKADGSSVQAAPVSRKHRYVIGTLFPVAICAALYVGFSLRKVPREPPVSPAPTRPVATVTEDSYDFRRSRWGDTRADVQFAEGPPVHSEQDGYMVYVGTFADKPVYIGYLFAGDSLVEGSYLFVMPGHDEPGGWVVERAKVSAYISRRVGLPQHEGQLTDFLDGRSLFSSWETDRTTIQQILFRKDGEIKHTVRYVDKRFEADDTGDGF